MTILNLLASRCFRARRDAAGRLFLAVCLVLGSGACGPPSPPHSPGAEYRNEFYGYSVHHPDSLRPLEYLPEYVVIGRDGVDGFDAVVELVLETGADGASWEDFVVRRAREACADGGPGGVVSCGAVQGRRPFTTNAGLDGIVFHLEQIATRGTSQDPTTRGRLGPIFALDVGSPAGHPWEVLFVRPPMLVDAAEVDAEVVRAVAESVR